MNTRPYLLLISMLFLGCAQVRNPQGGPRDKEGPVLIKADPEPMSTGFTGKEIVLEFDEYIELVNVREQVLISPPLDVAPEIELKGNKQVLIDLSECTLEPDRTYTIQFGEAIVDYNERNPLEANTFLFSTGDYIDSLEITGQVVDAAYGEPVKEGLVMLFASEKDSIQDGARPLYVSRIEAEGRFLLPHLADAEYQLFALVDIDRDMRIAPTEKMAFLPNRVSAVVDDSVGHHLRMFSPLAEPRNVKSHSWSSDGRFLRFISGWPDSIAPIEGPVLQQLVYAGREASRPDSVQFWFAPPVEEGAMLFVGDSISMDTLTAGRVKAKDEYPSLIADFKLAHPDTSGHFRFVRPVSSFDTSLIRFEIDSLVVPFSIDEIIEPTQNIPVAAEWTLGKSMQLTVLPGAFTDIYSGVNDTLQQRVPIQEKTAFGDLVLDVDLPDSSNYVIQLIDPSKEVILETKRTQDFKWRMDYLVPGRFRVRVVEDADNNGRWSPGNYKKLILPERVFISEAEFAVRANWSLEEVLEVEF